jgi:glycosyltransferase involved in cell wall biosynthesis
MIGPDDDGIKIHHQCVHYLGQQPRSVVRGALLACFALCNMSNSESFGIVLLEAWLARKPVIVNKNCSAFLDIAIDNVNSILADSSTLKQSIFTLYSDRAFAEYLGGNGFALANKYSWKHICDEFVEICDQLISESLH